MSSKNSETYSRWQEAAVLNALKNRRVVILVGPRQCGKTTLVQLLEGSQVIYRSLDDAALLKIAKESPQTFIKHDQQTMIIDEVQRVPELLMAIKEAVDKDTRYGQYLLTGSANVQDLPTVRESLAGRVKKVRLHTLTQAEIAGVSADFIKRAFHQQFPSKVKGCDRDDVLRLATRGGYPEVLDKDFAERKSWHKDYVDALIENDLKDIANVKDLDAMQELVRALYAWSSKAMNKSSILSQLSISKPTFESYLAALKNMYLFEDVMPWIRTDYEYLNKQKRLFASDAGMMSSLLNWSFDNVHLDSDRSGKLIETFVYNELIAQIDCHVNDYKLYHYRDKEQREVDFIIENADGEILGIEVKAGSNLGKNSFQHLSFFEKSIIPGRPFTGIVLYTGEHTIQFADNLWAVPIGAIWNLKQ